MKKGLALAISLILLCGVMFACPPKNSPQPSPQPQPQPQPPSGCQIQSANDAASIMQQAAAKEGFRVDAQARDVNGNGVADLVLTWNSPLPNDEAQVKALLYVTGMAAGVGELACFRTDLIVLRMSGQEYRAKIADCVRCGQLAENNASDDQIIQCVIDAWGLD